MHDFLLEIGLEEMPAHVVTPTLQQLKEKTENFLAEAGISYATINSFATPRRLALQILGLPEKQEDTQEEAKGPAKKIAQDDKGNWTKAALGFARGQGAAPEDLFFKELNGVEYVYVNKYNIGKKTADVLLNLKGIVENLNFPVTMHWANHDFTYIRPVHWVVALLDEEVLPLEIFEIPAGNVSRGHRFLGKDTTVVNPESYEESLLAQFVIVDPSARKEMIRQQIAKFAKDNSWQIVLDEDLLEEVNNLVEYPTAFVGNFSKKYLEVPQEVLVTSMKEHQRYFDVRDADGKLLPHFIAVRNGNSEKIANVQKGNEKVLTARLEDAEFFYQEDLKLSIDHCVEKLKNVTFHEKIGSVYEKMSRVHVLAEKIGARIGLDDTQLADLARASDIYKFDLVTNMVGEFPELQGVMGEIYAQKQGEDAAVATAIREHYLPSSAEGELPETSVGAVLAVADKLDSLLTFFNVDLAPTSSNDPYALRRQAYGVIRILANEKWSLSIPELLSEAVEIYNQDVDTFGLEFRDDQQLLFTFVKGRLRQLFAGENIRYDVIEAIVNGQHEDLNKMLSAARLLKKHLSDDNFKSAVEALTRVINLGKKAMDLAELKVNPDLFENNSERTLYDAVEDLKKQFPDLTLEEQYEKLAGLQDLIENYFAETMVMSDDVAIKKNRLTQLKEIADLTFVIGSLELLNVK
ncbi:glycine--tRNA ligase subunit beta [Enterococcus timonensis]|uniref:glycine--tRNA ligase subunit beta n=1 Tax=Enterococcus timonensis TaxID=1852364 RepID=UPI0008DAA61C|nr:glycine--tRNA ligase subunit beta [Enterococcus timonensis]